MDDFEKISVDEILRSELGKKADFDEYTAENRTPMSFALDEARKQIGDIFSVYWIQGGFPEIFCLNGFSKKIIAFSTRYLSLSTLIRQLFISELLKEHILEISERTALQIIAEVAIRKGDPDLAVLAFAKSVTEKSISLSWGENEQTDIWAMESEPLSERYMAMWFYGLMHELGHFTKYQNQNLPASDFSDENILKHIQKALNHFSYSEEVKSKIIACTKNKIRNSVIEIGQIRSEVLADIFACSMIFKTTYNIMAEVDKKDEFKITSFISESFVFHHIISFMDRCKRVASIASSTATSQEALLDFLAHPVAIAVRRRFQINYLIFAVTEFIYGETPTDEEQEKVNHIISEIDTSYKDAIEKINIGLDKALTFSIRHEDRENDWLILEKFRKDLSKPNLLSDIATSNFSEMAKSLGKDSKLLQQLNIIQSNPNEKISPDFKGDLLYWVPWVEGPNNFSQPFNLDTKYGRMVFVFSEKNKLYEEYFAVSAEDLADGFELTDAALLTPRENQIGTVVAEHMPVGKFLLVVQGTKLFNQYIQELANGSIFS